MRQATISFVMFVRLSVRMEQFGSQWTDFHEILYLTIFRKSVEKSQVLLKPDKRKGYLKRRPIHIFFLDFSYRAFLYML